MDYNFGYDSNGYEIDEATVEELARIADEIFARADVYSGIDVNTFKKGYYLTGTAFGADLHYALCASFCTDTFDMSGFVKPDFNGTLYSYKKDDDIAYANIDLELFVDNENIIVTSIDVDCFVNDGSGRFDYKEFEVKHFFEKFDKEKIKAKVIECLTPAVREVHAVVSSL